MAGPYGVYNGLPGAGEAFLLPDNQAAQIFNNNLSNQQKQARMEALQRQKLQAEQQQNITDNLAKISPGEYWVNHDKEIQDNYKKVIDFGSELKSKNQDPFANRDFLRMRENLMADAKFSKQLQDEYKIVASEIQKNPNGYDNLDEVLSYYSPNRSIADYKKTGYERPALNRAFSLSDAVKASNGTVSYIKNNDGYTDTTKINKSGIIDQAIGSTDLPEAKYLIRKSGGFEDVYTKGFPTVTKDGKRFWNNKPELVEDIAIKTLSSDPSFPEVLKSKGYDITDKEKVLQSAKDFIAKQNKAVGSYVEEYTKKVAGAGTTDFTKVFAAEANARANAAAARDKERLSISKGKTAKEEQSFETRKRIISGLQNKNQDTLKDLRAALSIDNGTAEYKDEGGKPYLVVNRKSKNLIDGRFTDDPPIRIDLSDPSSYTAIDQLLEKSGFSKLEKKVTPDDAGTGQRYSETTLSLFNED